MVRDLCRRIEQKDRAVSAYVIHNGIAYRQEGDSTLLIVPQQLIDRVLYSYHQESGHLGRDRVLKLLQKRFFWASLRDDVERWCKACQGCRKVKPPRPLKNGLLQPIVNRRPFKLVSMDIVGPFRCTTRNNKYVLVMIDYFTSWVEAAPLASCEARDLHSQKYQNNSQKYLCIPKNTVF